MLPSVIDENYAMSFDRVSLNDGRTPESSPLSVADKVEETCDSDPFAQADVSFASELASLAPKKPPPTMNFDDSLKNFAHEILSVKRPTSSPAPPVQITPSSVSSTSFDPEAQPLTNRSSSPSLPSEFRLPSNPTGRSLVINILSTWGDPYYVGLTGIEFFDDKGKPVRITDRRQIRADPPDINVLPGYGSDPRTLDKLFDGVNRTCDDFHMWLAPFTAGNNHFIYVDFDSSCTFSLIRFWNYNKSRVHTSRGARYIEVHLDRQLIFKGEIHKAPGSLAGSERMTECLLYTSDEGILKVLEQYDRTVYQRIEGSPDESSLRLKQERPTTAKKGERQPISSAPLPPSNDTASPWPPQPSQSTPALSLPAKLRPHTSANRARDLSLSIDLSAFDAIPLAVGRKFKINIRSTWGDMETVGLTGLQVLTKDRKPIDLSPSSITVQTSSKPPSEVVLPEESNPERLLNGKNVTTEERNMWLIPFTPGNDHVLRIDFGSPMEVWGVKIWNYNASLDDSYKGARHVHFWLDQTSLSPSDLHLLRKGPGISAFDFGQTIRLMPQSMDERNAAPPKSPAMDRLEMTLTSFVSVHQDYETPTNPTAFSFKFHFISTWGDAYYLGLNGIELYDETGDSIPITPENIFADPASINVLPQRANMEDDLRTPDKLIDGINDTWNDTHMWLAPYNPDSVNVVEFIFDRPFTLSMVKIWNYTKTPSRGAKEYELFADDIMISRGYVRRAPPAPPDVADPLTAIPTTSFVQTILFTSDPRIVNRERNNVFSYTEDALNECTILIDNNKIVTPSSSPSPAAAVMRPGTSVVGPRGRGPFL